MNELKQKIEELQAIRLRQDRSYLPILQEELFFETNPSVSRELRQTIVYLQFLDNPYSIEDFIPEHLKAMSFESVQNQKFPLLRSFLVVFGFALGISLIGLFVSDAKLNWSLSFLEQNQTLASLWILIQEKFHELGQWFS